MSKNEEHYDPTEHEPLPEGEETPPPYVRTMALVRWVLLIAISIFALVMILNYAGVFHGASKEHQTVQYHCPMHPTYISNQPGDCPICGMTLVPDSSSENKMDMNDTNQSVKDTLQSMSDMGQAPVPGLVPITIEPRRLQLIGVRTARVERRPAAGSISIVGVIAPDETRLHNISLRVIGWVQTTFVDKTGQFVEKGQRLVSIYSQELFQAEQDYFLAREASVRGATDSSMSAIRNQLINATRDRLRLLGLSERELLDIDTMTSPQSELTFHSPVAGYVLQKSVLPGQYINPDQALFTIADLGQVWVLGDVYEQDLPYVTIGQKVNITLTAHPDRVFSGDIDYIYPTVSEATRTASVRIKLANPNMLLRPGMYATISVDRGGAASLMIPVEAVVDGGTVKYAFVVTDGNHFEPRALTIGRSSDDWVEVVKGLDEGETVVTSANFLIDSESRLKAAVSGMAGMPGM